MTQKPAPNTSSAVPRSGWRTISRRARPAATPRTGSRGSGPRPSCALEVPGQHQRQRDLHHFRRLDAGDAQVQPARGALAGFARQAPPPPAAPRPAHRPAARTSSAIWAGSAPPPTCAKNAMMKLRALVGETPIGAAHRGMHDRSGPRRSAAPGWARQRPIEGRDHAQQNQRQALHRSAPAGLVRVDGDGPLPCRPVRLVDRDVAPPRRRVGVLAATSGRRGRRAPGLLPAATVRRGAAPGIGRCRGPRRAGCAGRDVGLLGRRVRTVLGKPGIEYLAGDGRGGAGAPAGVFNDQRHGDARVVRRREAPMNRAWSRRRIVHGAGVVARATQAVDLRRTGLAGGLVSRRRREGLPRRCPRVPRRPLAPFMTSRLAWCSGIW